MDESSNDNVYRVTREEIRSFVERIENLNIEKNEISEQQNQQTIANDLQESILESKNQMSTADQQDTSSIPSGVSMENASYIESNSDNSLLESDLEEANLNTDLSNEEEFTPQLFSDDNESHVESDINETVDAHTEKLFDQDSNEEEDFEIPAFLRKQKF